MTAGTRDVVAALASRLVAVIGPILVGIVTARVLGPAGRGEYFLVVAYAQIAAQIANLGLQSSNTYLAATRPELVGRLLVNSLYVALIVAPITAAIVVLLFAWPQSLVLGPEVEGTGSIVLCSVLLAPLMVGQLYLTNMAVGVGRVRLFNGLTIAYSGLSVVFAAVAAISSSGPLSFVIAAGMSLLAIVLYASMRLFGGLALSLKFDAALFRTGIGYAAKAYLATMLSFLMARVGVLSLQYYADLAELGVFSVALQITDGLLQLPATIGLLVFPMLLRSDPAHRRRVMWNALFLLGGAMASTLVLTAVAGYWLVPMIFGTAFEASYPLMLWLLPQVLILSLTTIISKYLAAEGYPPAQVVAWFIGFVVQASLCFLLAPRWGAMGVAIATDASSFLVFLLLFAELFRGHRGKDQLAGGK